jgi:Ser/Thr protein kinase RdoA (MazF antagonist)
MPEHMHPTDRLAYEGDLEPVIERLSESYGVGHVRGFSVVEIGFEDCNVIIETDQDKFIAKMFARTRTPEDVTRYTTIMKKVVEAGVQHPALVSLPNGGVTYTDSGISLVLMHFAEGKTFLELDQVPDDAERRSVLEQAAKINQIDYKPPYLFDSWAIPNIRSMYDRVKPLIKPDELQLAKQAIAQYESIPVDELPHCFVHGDLTKANVVRGDDGKIYVLDFSVANWYPRIQELAVIIANLLHDNESSLDDLVDEVANEYNGFNQLTPIELDHLRAYTISGIAMEFMGGLQEKYINGHDHEETDYWIKLGRDGLTEALL